jgi:hypothetical protein
MRKRLWFALVGIALAAATTGVAQESSTRGTVTLYSSIKYQNDLSRALFDFQRAALAPRRGHYDVGYGLLYAGEEFDWFQSAGDQGNRSVIKDLGEHAWTDGFVVPAVEPLAKLKPGEQRQITVDTSGADGADGAPGADGDGIVRQRATVQRPKNDGKPKVDPIFVRAVVGHLYVIHVVDDSRDFYALFRVESLQRGDNCTISWKLIESPAPTRWEAITNPNDGNIRTTNTD